MPPSVHKETSGGGWGCLRALTAFVVAVFSLLGLIAIFPSDPAGVWTALIAALVLTGLWWGAAKVNHFRGLLAVGPLGAVLFALVFGLLGYLVRGR